MLVTTETTYPITITNEEIEKINKAEDVLEDIIHTMLKYDCERLNNDNYGDVSITELKQCKEVLSRLRDFDLYEMY